MGAPREEQQLGFWMTWALVVGTMIGAGIFMLPVSLAPLGPNAVVAWLISGMGALCIAFSLSRLADADGAGIQAYIEREFGPTVGFIVACAFWCSNWTSCAAVAIAAAAALSAAAPTLSGPYFIVSASLAFLALLTAVNARGARTAGGLSIVTVVVKLFPLVAVIVILGTRAAGEQPWEPLASQPITVPSIATAVALTLFALLGFENATTPVGKVRDPARTIPRAIMLGTAFVAFLYLLSSTAVTLIVPAATVAGSPAPFADAIGTQWGSTAMILAALAIAVSAFGCLNGLILATGELGYSMALRRQLPASIARTRGAGTPVNAQILGCVLAMVLVLANSSRTTAGLFTFVILLSTVSVLVLYFIGTLAAWRKSPSTANRVLIAVALIFSLFAFYGSGLEANLWGLVLIAVGLAVRAVMHRLNARVGSSPMEELASAVPPGSSA